eukprot:Hpha_TRINITY_DN34400_c0_g1::TRINITY_DN34400_c0_g1_i1::g.96128::m.96128
MVPQPGEVFGSRHFAALAAPGKGRFGSCPSTNLRYVTPDKAPHSVREIVPNGAPVLFARSLTTLDNILGQGTRLPTVIVFCYQYVLLLDPQGIIRRAVRSAGIHKAGYRVVDDRPQVLLWVPVGGYDVLMEWPDDEEPSPELFLNILDQVRSKQSDFKLQDVPMNKRQSVLLEKWEPGPEVHRAHPFDDHAKVTLGKVQRGGSFSAGSENAHFGIRTVSSRRFSSSPKNARDHLDASGHSQASRSYAHTAPLGAAQQRGRTGSGQSSNKLFITTLDVADDSSSQAPTLHNTNPGTPGQEHAQSTAAWTFPPREVDVTVSSRRPSLGVDIEVHPGVGAVVTGVTPGGAAERAGLEAPFVLLMLNGQDAGSEQGLKDAYLGVSQSGGKRHTFQYAGLPAEHPLSARVRDPRRAPTERPSAFPSGAEMQIQVTPVRSRASLARNSSTKRAVNGEGLEGEFRKALLGRATDVRGLLRAAEAIRGSGDWEDVRTKFREKYSAHLEQTIAERLSDAEFDTFREALRTRANVIIARPELPTFASSGLDADIADRIMHAIQGIVVDETALFGAMTSVSSKGQWANVQSAFKHRYPCFRAGKLKPTLESELTPEQLRTVRSLLQRRGIEWGAIETHAGEHPLEMQARERRERRSRDRAAVEHHQRREAAMESREEAARRRLVQERAALSMAARAAAEEEESRALAATNLAKAAATRAIGGGYDRLGPVGGPARSPAREGTHVHFLELVSRGSKHWIADSRMFCQMCRRPVAHAAGFIRCRSCPGTARCVDCWEGILPSPAASPVNPQ